MILFILCNYRLIDEMCYVKFLDSISCQVCFRFGRNGFKISTKFVKCEECVRNGCKCVDGSWQSIDNVYEDTLAKSLAEDKKCERFFQEILDSE